MNISLPAELKDWVDDQVSGKGYSTASEYVRDLLRREQDQQTRAYVEKKLLEALDSGPPTPMAPDFYDRIRAEGLKRVRNRRKK